MAIIQPFSYQFCTAFRERKQMADKINEIVDAINGSETVEGLTTRIENLETGLETFEDQTNQNIESLNDKISNIENWQIVSEQELSSIITNQKLNTDILIRIGNTSGNFADLIEGEQFMYLPKGLDVNSAHHTFMFSGHWTASQCYQSNVILRNSDFISVTGIYVDLYVIVYDVINGTVNRQQISFNRRDYSTTTPYMVFYKRVMSI